VNEAAAMVAAYVADESYDLVAHIPLLTCDSVRCVGATTPKWIDRKLLRSIRLRQASLGEEDEM
jgi:hypothetical protein